MTKTRSSWGKPADAPAPVPGPDAPPPDVDQYYFKPRREPWPIIGGVLLVVMGIWAAWVWTSDDSIDLDATTTTLARSGGTDLSEADLAGCFAFQAGASQYASLLKTAATPEGAAMAASGTFTRDVLDGYIAAADSVSESFDGKAFRALMVAFQGALEKFRDEALAAEAAGTPTWGEMLPDVTSTVVEYGGQLEDMCAAGGVMVNVIP